MTAHEKAVGGSVEWYTPPELFYRLGTRFDLDPAGAAGDCVPADQSFFRAYDGLPREWTGHVWLNPPYGPAGVPFIDRMIAHGDGLLLLPSRTETAAYQRCLAAAEAVCLLRDRLWFTRSDGFRGRSSFGSTLFAFGDWAADVLTNADLGWMARQGHHHAGRRDANHYDWFMPTDPTADVDDYLDDFEAKMLEALTDPFVHDMAHVVLPLIEAYRLARGERAA